MGDRAEQGGCCGRAGKDARRRAAAFGLCGFMDASDWLGTALMATGLAGLFAVQLRTRRHGWSGQLVVAMLVGIIVAVSGFLLLTAQTSYLPVTYASEFARIVQHEPNRAPARDGHQACV